MVHHRRRRVAGGEARGLEAGGARDRGFQTGDVQGPVSRAVADGGHTFKRGNACCARLRVGTVAGWPNRRTVSLLRTGPDGTFRSKSGRLEMPRIRCGNDHDDALPCRPVTCPTSRARSFSSHTARCRTRQAIRRLCEVRTENTAARTRALSQPAAIRRRLESHRPAFPDSAPLVEFNADSKNRDRHAAARGSGVLLFAANEILGHRPGPHALGNLHST